MTEERPRFPIADFRDSVRAKYGDVAANPGKDFHFHTGRPLADRLGYPTVALAGIPEEAVESFSGVANMLDLADFDESDTVVDVGCGSGMDALLATRELGTAGSVVGIDLVPAMIGKAKAAAAAMGATQTEFIVGLAEDLPLSDGFADVVMSNAVINLCPDKAAILSEMHRVLRPGGRLYVADLVLERVPPRSVRDLIYRWTSCVVGATVGSELLRLAEAAGFEELEVTSTVDVFDGARGEANADHYGTLAFAVRAAKAAPSAVRAG